MLTRILLWSFAVLLAVAPLPLGSNKPIPWTLLALATGVLLLCWGLLATFRRTDAFFAPQVLLPSIIGFGLVGFWVLIQMSPLTPRDWHHPVWLRASEVFGGDVIGHISLDPHASGTALMRLLSYAGVFWIAWQLGRAPLHARRIIQTVALAGFGYAVYGLIVHLLDLNTILWWRKWANEGYLTSTFVNQNSYATFAGLGLICAAGLLIQTGYPRLLANADPNVGAGTGLSHVRIGLFRLLRSAWWLLLMSVTIALAAVLTASRAGAASIAIGIVTLIFCMGRGRIIGERHLWGALIGAAACGAALFALAGHGLQERLAATSLNESRFSRYERVVDAMLDSPLTGTGYGTFAAAFFPYDVFWLEASALADDDATANKPGADEARARETVAPRQIVSARWYDAHNTYLENAFELGIPAALILIASVGVPVLALARGLQRSPEGALYASIGLAATALVGAHALFDFSLEIPAVAVTYAGILGVALARAQGRGDARVSPGAPAWKSPCHLSGIALASAVAIGILALGVPRAIAHVIGLPMTVAKRDLDAKYIPDSGQLDRAIAAGRQAAQWSNAAEFSWSVGIAELTQAHRQGLVPNAQRTRLEKAEEALERSLRLAPANPAAWAQLAYVAQLLGRPSVRIGGALRLSVLTGPNHPPLLAFRSAVALRNWAHLDEATRALFHRQFALTLHVSPGPFIKAIRGDEEIEIVRSSLQSDAPLTTRFNRLVRLLR